MTKPKFLDIYYADLTLARGSVQGGVRPVLIVQNDIGNEHSTTTTVIPLSCRVGKATYMPTHVNIEPCDKNGLRAESMLLVEQIQTVDDCQLRERIGTLDYEYMDDIRKALMIQIPVY